MTYTDSFKLTQHSNCPGEGRLVQRLLCGQRHTNTPQQQLYRRSIKVVVKLRNHHPSVSAN